jgi:hypothetical protein
MKPLLRHFARTPDHLLLDSAPNIGPLISRRELEKFKYCWNTSFRASKILTLSYQQFSNLLISQRNMSGPRSGALSNNRWLGVSKCQDLSWTERHVLGAQTRTWQSSEEFSWEFRIRFANQTSYSAAELILIVCLHTAQLSSHSLKDDWWRTWAVSMTVLASVAKLRRNEQQWKKIIIFRYTPGGTQ